ncbi:MAG: Type 1 glutamine amidotransferase-like domain-containing protein [Microthrixaceae bacterium]
MTGSLALVGGAAFGATLDHHRGVIPEGATVTFLPTAKAYENPAALVDSAEQHIEALGATLEVVPVYSRADASDPARVEQVERAEVLYLAGGSPMHLRSVLVDSPLLEAGLRAWEGGTTVVAEAEATSVLCSHMVDNRGGAFTVGVGLIRSFTVIGRFDRWSPDKRHRTVGLAPADLPVVGIDEATTLLRDESGNWTSFGAGEVHVFTGGHRVGLDRLPRDLT